MDNILYREESYKIIGACFEVYNELGCGYLEAVYQEKHWNENFSYRTYPIKEKAYWKYKRLEHR